jgi:uncharacterized protein (DUF1778 family)
MTSIKEARLDFRLDPEVKARIERAAKLAHESISSFVVRAAAAEADRVLARSDVTMMPTEQFDELLASLDIADEAPALARLGKTERRYLRK